MDFVPSTPPMIPSIIVHCVNEIEQRGLHEVKENEVWKGAIEMGCGVRETNEPEYLLFMVCIVLVSEWLDEQQWLWRMLRCGEQVGAERCQFYMCTWHSASKQCFLLQTGLYRVSGCDKTVRELKEKFLRAKNVPLLSKVDDIHAICGLLKDFLRSLKEPLLTFRLNKTFMEAAGKEAAKWHLQIFS